MRISIITTILLALALTACGEDLKYDEDAQPVLTTINVSAHAASSLGGGPLPIIQVTVEGGGRSFTKQCGQMFGQSGCSLQDEVNRFHVGDELRVSAEHTVCLYDCTIMDHTFTLESGKQVTKTFQNVGSSATVTIKVKPLSS